MVKMAKRRLLNAVWAVSYEEVPGGKVKLTGHWRDDTLPTPTEGESTYRLLGTDGRIVIHLVVAPVVFGTDPKMADLENREGAQKFEVVNQEHVFSYGAPEKIPGTAAED